MTLRFGNSLRELRIHLCQTSKASQGARDFIEKHYVSIKKENPTFPILIRECSNVQPVLWARYYKGVERRVPLTNLAASDVLAALKQLAK